MHQPVVCDIFTRLSSVPRISGIFTLRVITMLTIHRSIHQSHPVKPFKVSIRGSQLPCKTQHFPLGGPLIQSVSPPLSFSPDLRHVTADYSLF